MFQGHAIASLISDVAWALAAGLITYCFVSAVKAKHKIASTLLAIPYIVITPNATYAFLEVKHLILRDGIAEPCKIESLAVFGSIALTGLFLAVLCILATTYTLKIKHTFVAIVALSTIHAVGAALGMLDVISTDVVSNPNRVYEGLRTLATTNQWIMFVVILTVFLTALTLVIRYWIEQKKQALGGG